MRISDWSSDVCSSDLSVLVGMNDRDAKWHDLYRVDLGSGERTLVERNTQEFAGYVADADYKVRLATRARPDGGQDVLKPDGKGGWEVTEEDRKSTRLDYSHEGASRMPASR